MNNFLIFFNKYKIYFISFFAIFLISLFIFFFNRNNIFKSLDQNSLANLEELNRNYSLIHVEPFNVNSNNSKYFTSLFQLPAFSTNIVSGAVNPLDIVIELEGKGDRQNMDNILLLKLNTDENPQNVIDNYKNIKGIKNAELNYDIELNGIFDFDFLSSKKKPDTINIEEENIIKEVDRVVKKDNKKDVVVALIDSGVNKHEDLKDKLVDGYDFLSNYPVYDDEVGHGTHVAGIISMYSDALIMPLKFTDGKRSKVTDVARAVNYAVSKKVDIINLSLGLKSESSLLKYAVNNAINNDIIVVAAAGNYNTDKPYYPAYWDGVVSVAALSKNGSKLYASNYGDWIDFSFLGEDIYSTSKDGTYEYRTGTSQSTPVVSALFANSISDGNKRDIAMIDDIESEFPIINYGNYANQLGRRLNISKKKIFDNDYLALDDIYLFSEEQKIDTVDTFISRSISKEDDDTITRSEASSIVAIALGMDPVYNGDLPKDVEEWDKNTPFIRAVLKNNPKNLFPDGEFKPNNKLNRQELLLIIMSGFDLKDPSIINKTYSFIDVGQEAWYKKEMINAIDFGLISGDDYKFSPLEEVTRFELAKWIIKSRSTLENLKNIR